MRRSVLIKRALGLAVVGGAAMVIVPATGMAATVSVAVGHSTQNGDFDATAYQPRVTTIHKGDSVKFEWGGFHTVVFPARGQKVPSILTPTNRLEPVTNDPAGVPYWWSNTLPILTLNPQVAIPSKRKSVDGVHTVNSGFPNFGPRGAPPFTVTFSKVGAFRFGCGVHPNMKGTIIVKPKSARVPTAAAVARKGKAELAGDLKAANKLKKKAVKPDEVLVGAGTRDFEVYAMLGGKKTVPAGTTLNFRWAGREEAHTVTFGPTAFVDLVQRTFEAAQADQPGEAIYPSDPPTVSPVPISPTSHGNGFLNSGVLFDPGAGPGNHSFQVTFSTPGVYSFRCIIHSNMRGTITVT
jgi:plastocyanin